MDPSLLVEASPDIIFVLDVEGRVTYINPVGLERLGRSRSQVVGHSMTEYLHPDDLELGVSSLQTVQTKAVGSPIEVRIACTDGWRWFEVVGRPCLDVPGIWGVVLGARDITDRRMWEVAGSDVVRFQQVVQHASALVLTLDAEGVVTSANGALNRLLGLDPSLAIGTRLASHAALGHGEGVDEAVATARVSGSARVEVEMTHSRDARQVPVRFEIVNLLDDPVVAGLVVTGQDVSDLSDARRQLEHLATHDPLTGIPNRALLLERLGRLQAEHTPVAVLYADLDAFKPVNDTHGHDAGDELLQLAARRLVTHTGHDDLVARVGGDEFVVLAVGVADQETAEAIAARLEAMLEGSYRIASGVVEVSASIGAIVATPAVAASRLLSLADGAMYARKAARMAERKQSGRGPIS